MLRACRSRRCRVTGRRNCSLGRRAAWCSDEALDDFDHWRPADGRRAQLDELRSVAIEARWEAALAEGSANDLIPDLEAFVADEPLRERRWALLLTAYQRAGRAARVAGLRAGSTHAGGRARRVARARPLPPYESLLREESGSNGAPAPSDRGPSRSCRSLISRRLMRWPPGRRETTRAP